MEANTNAPEQNQAPQQVDPEVRQRDLADADLFYQEGVAALRDKLYDIAVEQLAKSMELKYG
jgi:hypothetical protein